MVSIGCLKMEYSGGSYWKELLEQYRAHEGQWPGLISCDHGIMSHDVDL